MGFPFARVLMVMSALFLLAAPEAQATVEGRLLKFYNGTWQRQSYAQVLDGAGAVPGSAEDPLHGEYRPMVSHGLCGADSLEIKKKTWQHVLKVDGREGSRELRRDLRIGTRYRVRESENGSRNPSVPLSLREEVIVSGGLLPGNPSAGAHFQRLVTEENPGEVAAAVCTAHSVAGEGCFRRSSEVIQFKPVSDTLIEITINRSHQQGRNTELTRIRPVRCQFRRDRND